MLGYSKGLFTENGTYKNDTMNKEELQKKHLEAIVQFIEQGHAGSIAGKMEAAASCTTISLQAVVEVLKKCFGNEDKSSREVAMDVFNQLNKYTNLLNQNK
jgi:hypothetical protein